MHCSDRDCSESHAIRYRSDVSACRLETVIKARGCVQLPLILVSGASRTARGNGFGDLYTPATGNVINTDRVWALDNGAFAGFDREAFLKRLDRMPRDRSRCAFVACPDVVGDWDETRRLFGIWYPILRRYEVPIACVGQDGVTVSQFPYSDVDAVFLGGSTAWKLSRVARDLASYGHACGRWVHMGRVNTFRRYRYATQIGCHSVDGTFFSRWPDHAARQATAWRRRLERQPELFA